MRDDRANHDNGKQDRRIEGIAGNQQADAARHFQKAGQIPEPLADADFVEQFDYGSGTGEFGAAGPYKGKGDKAGRIQRVMRRRFRAWLTARLSRAPPRRFY
jgi:hypothetical protein